MPPHNQEKNPTHRDVARVGLVHALRVHGAVVGHAANVCMEGEQGEEEEASS